MAKEELGRRWVGIDKEDFSELVEGRLKEIESMFATDLGVVHRLDAPVKTVRLELEASVRNGKLHHAVA